MGKGRAMRPSPNGRETLREMVEVLEDSGSAHPGKLEFSSCGILGGLNPQGAQSWTSTIYLKIFYFCKISLTSCFAVGFLLGSVIQSSCILSFLFLRRKK